MRYEFMFPRQLEAAKAARAPFILPIGTIEYHGPHCAYGCDGLIAQGLAHRLEERLGAVVLPTLWYGCSSYAVGGPETGTIDVGCDSLKGALYDMLMSLTEGGIRNTVILIHHQFEQESYMPATLAAAMAAKTVIMAYLERERGRGWWGKGDAGYYEALDGADNPFNWIRVLPCMSASVQRETGYDHAGKYECSLLAAMYPDAFEPEAVALSDEWFIQSAKEASAEYGERMLMLALDALAERIEQYK